MASLYLLNNAKLTRNDGTLIRRGKFYTWGTDYDYVCADSGNFVNYSAQSDSDVSSMLAVARMNGKFDSYVLSKLTAFAPKWSQSIPSDYPQVNPFSPAVKGFNTPDEIYFADSWDSETIWRFYPDANDNTFYMIISIYHNSVTMTLHRNGVSDVRLGSIQGTWGWSNGGTNCYYVVIPWILKATWNPHGQFDGRGIIYTQFRNRYPFIGPSSSTEMPETISSDIRLSGDVNSGWNTFLNGFSPEVFDTDNPYASGGTSIEGGGDGNFSEESDDVTVDQLPSIDAVGTGFATLFTPSKTQLKALADIMWDSNVFTALQNLVENITGMFTSLAIVPFEVLEGRTVEVTWFGFAWTEIFLTLALQQYYEFDMGSIDLKNDSRIFTSGSALDYSPFSTLGIFLPFIGFQELDIDECRDSVINLKYRIDILSGTCVALISLNGNTVYQFTGNCLSQIPITNENMQSLVTDAVQVGIAAAATHSAKSAVGAAESALSEAEQADSGVKSAKASLGHAEAHLAQAKAGLGSATANASMGIKPVYGKAGAISASASLLAVKQPYLFLRSPRQSIPEHYQRYCGFPCNMSGKLSSFSGYTVVEDIRLNGLVATSPEVAEIYQLLKGGVII